MDYIFNELSIQEVDNIHTARSILTDFVKTCTKVQSSLSLKTLRIPESIGNLYNVFLTVALFVFRLKFRLRLVRYLQFAEFRVFSFFPKAHPS